MGIVFYFSWQRINRIWNVMGIDEGREGKEINMDGSWQTWIRNEFVVCTYLHVTAMKSNLLWVDTVWLFAYSKLLCEFYLLKWKFPAVCYHLNQSTYLEKLCGYPLTLNCCVDIYLLLNWGVKRLWIPLDTKLLCVILNSIYDISKACEDLDWFSSTWVLAES